MGFFALASFKSLFHYMALVFAEIVDQVILTSRSVTA
jgi:hypothetical protein